MYILVKFGDNDFGNVIVESLKELYEYLTTGQSYVLDVAQKLINEGKMYRIFRHIVNINLAKVEYSSIIGRYQYYWDDSYRELYKIKSPCPIKATDERLEKLLSKKSIDNIDDDYLIKEDSVWLQEYAWTKTKWENSEMAELCLNGGGVRLI